jgi:glycosyltransferase involved in cell wall biosynthesis
MEKTNPDPLVSILIACYNAETFISGTLKSVTSQVYKNIEIICINDGSADNTLTILEKLREEDPRIKIINKENGGLESAIKSALGQISGEYTFLLGHDDRLSPDAISKAYLAFKEDPSLDAVRLDLNFVFSDKSKNYSMKDRRRLTGIEALKETISVWKIHTVCLWKTEIYKRMSGVEGYGVMNFDDLATRFLYSTCKFVGYCDGYQDYIQHENSVTKKISPKLFEPILTDALFRKIIGNAGVYNGIAANYEKNIFENMVRLGFIYFRMKDISKEEKQKAKNFFKAGYKEINKPQLIKNYPFMKKIIYLTALTSFATFFMYLNLLSRFHRLKGSNYFIL